MCSKATYLLFFILKINKFLKLLLVIFYKFIFSMSLDLPSRTYFFASSSKKYAKKASVQNKWACKIVTSYMNTRNTNPFSEWDPLAFLSFSSPIFCPILWKPILWAQRLVSVANERRIKSRCFWLLFAAMPKSNEPSTECWMRYRWIWCMSRTDSPKTWKVFWCK